MEGFSPLACIRESRHAADNVIIRDAYLRISSNEKLMREKIVVVIDADVAILMTALLEPDVNFLAAWGARNMRRRIDDRRCHPAM